MGLNLYCESLRGVVYVITFCCVIELGCESAGLLMSVVVLGRESESGAGV